MAPPAGAGPQADPTPLVAQTGPTGPDRALAYHHFSLAQQRRLAGDSEGAIAEFRNALKLDPSSAEVLAQLARQLRDSGAFEEAFEHAQRAVKADRDNLLAHETLSELYRMQIGARGVDAVRDAAAELEEMLRVRPTDLRTLQFVAMYYTEIGDDAQAVEAWKRYLALDPGNYEAYVRLGMHQRSMGLAKDAASSFREALQLRPDSADAHSALGDALATESPEIAREHYEQAVEIEPGNLRVQLALAEVYSILGEYEKSLRRSEIVLQADAENLFALERKGRALRDLGRFDDASQVVAVMTRLAPDDLQGPFLGVSIAEAQGDPQASLEQLDRILSRDRSGEEADRAEESDRFALERKGRALRDLKRFDEALQIVDDLMELVPDDLGAAYLSVTIAEAQRDAEAAHEKLERLLARDRSSEDPRQTVSNDRIFLVHLGFASQQLDRPLEAADAFARARALGEESDPSVARYEVEALRRAEAFARALEVVREARVAFPEDSSLISSEASILRESGDAEGADALIDALKEGASKDPDTLLDVAEYYQRAKRYAEAEAILEDARQVRSDDVATLFQLGAVLERQKKHDAAEKAFRAALELEPESAPVLNYLGYMNADRGVRIPEALTLIERALELDPGNGAYLDSLGWALYRLDRLERAEETLRLAVEKEGSSAVLLDHLGDILDRRGDLRAALDFWQQALEGEDEDGELDRSRVQHKIKNAAAALEDAASSEQR
jgi:tetratricopeptide (TPR) repeat protein